MAAVSLSRQRENTLVMPTPALLAAYTTQLIIYTHSPYLAVSDNTRQIKHFEPRLSARSDSRNTLQQHNSSNINSGALEIQC